MPRVTQPQTARTTAPRTAASAGRGTSPKPATPARTDGAWGAQASRRPAAKPPLLGAPATMQTPATSVVGPATMPATIAGVRVQSATELQFEGLTGANKLMTRTLDVRFGKLSQPQFEALHKEFGGRSQVKFDATREYTAIDFLPPAVQALVNRDVDPGGPFKLAGTKKLNDAMGNEGRGDLEINASPNCHGTAWEMARVYQGQGGTHVNLIYGDAQISGGEYAEAGKFEKLGTAEPGQQPTFLDALKPGDLVAFQQGEYQLLHTAVYVGGGLFFEKPNTESDTYDESPYRLVNYQQALAPIAEFLGETPTAVALRPKVPLAAGTQTFTAAEDGTRVEAWAAKKGQPLGKPLVREFEVGLGGGIRGVHLNAVETMRVEIGADGRGVIR